MSEFQNIGGIIKGATLTAFEVGVLNADPTVIKMSPNKMRVNDIHA